MKLGTSIEAEPRHLSCDKTRAYKKEGGNCRPLPLNSRLKILVSAPPLTNQKY